MRRFLPLLVLTFWSAASWAQQEARLRIFIVQLGEPALAVDVNGEAAVTDESGTVRLEVRAAEGEVLRFRSLDPSWELDTVRSVPVEDPSVPVLWDLKSELQPVPVPTPPAPPPEVETVDPAVAATDPCRGRTSLRCRQAMWSRFQEALRRQDCRAAIKTLGELESDYPELLSGGDSVAAFAQTYLDCGLADGDELLIRRSVDLLSNQGGGELWCGVEESRLLARGYEAMGELATAAQGAAQARPRCPEGASSALEWEFYFRYRLGVFERLAGLAEEASGRLGLFLAAWLGLARGQCTTEVEVEPSGDLPCRGLPQEFCSRQYGRILLTCGTGTDDFKVAARYLSTALPPDPASWGGLLRAAQGRQLVAELAEAETLAGDHVSSLRRYELLLEHVESAGSDEQAALWRLYADALLSSGTEEETIRAALAAYERSRRNVEPASVAFAIVMNNICVLRGRLPAGADGARGEDDLEVLEEALEQVPITDNRLRLWLKRNLFAVRINLLEKETGLDAQERLARLRELRGPMTQYQNELRDLAEDDTYLPPVAADASFERIRLRGRLFTIALP